VVIYLGEDVSNTDEFRVVRGMRAQGTHTTLSVGVLHADSPACLIKSADVAVDGPACAKAFIEHLVGTWPGSTLAT
jgi:hypothetical protein